MLFRASALDAADRAQFEAHLRDLRGRVLEEVEALLVGLEDDHLAQHVYDTAFTDGEALPKRTQRPTLEPVLLAEQVYHHHASDADALGPVLRSTVVVQEYYDVVDDLVDGDVQPGAEAQVIVSTEALFPVLVGALQRIGPEALTYWRERTLELVRAPLFELRTEPSIDAYETLVERQSALFGVVAGLAAIAGGASEAERSDAERLGRTVFKHAQYVLDVEQHRSGDDDEWNALALSDADRVGDRLDEWRREVATLTESYSADRRTLIRALVALDQEAFLS